MRTMNKVPSAVRPVGAGNDKQGECCDKSLSFGIAEPQNQATKWNDKQQKKEFQ